MNKKLILISLFAAISLTSCSATKDGVPVSFFFNLDKSAVSVDNNVKPKLSGSACSYAFWPWATIGDSSITSAKSKAGITKVSTLDNEHFSIFTWSPAGWFFRTCSVVTGE